MTRRASGMSGMGAGGLGWYTLPLERLAPDELVFREGFGATLASGDFDEGDVCRFVSGKVVEKVSHGGDV